MGLKELRIQKKQNNIYLKYLYKKNLYFKITDTLKIMRVYKKQINIDFIYELHGLLKFLNILIKKGKKICAEKIFYNFITSVKIFLLKKNKLKRLQLKKTNIVILSLLKYIKIPFNVKNIRIGGRIYLVPFIVKLKQQQTIAIKFLINNFILKNNNKNKFLFKNIENVLNMFFLQSILNKQLYDYYKLVYENRAFAHYRWF